MNPMLFRWLWTLKHVPQREVISTLQQIRRTQWMPPEQLEELNWEKTRRIVSHAYQHCPYYRQKYGAVGFEPGDLKRPEDFSKLPILTKTEVREHLDEMVAEGTKASALLTRFTGGSTGVPLKVYHDRRAALPTWCLHQRTTERWGVKMGDKTAHIWGLNRLNEQYLYDRQSALRQFISNYALFSAFEMTVEQMQRFAQFLRSFRPSLVIGYASAMTAFARYLEENGGAGFRPKAMWLTSEPTHDFQREVVERVFGAPVYDQYGSVEIHHYAVECGLRDGLHIDYDFRKVEVVDQEGMVLPRGDEGQIIVTDFVNFAAPLIRYRNEDMGRLLTNQCACGRSLPMMGKVTGRIYDMFVLPDGSQIYGHRFTTFFYDYVEQVQAFQVHQTARDRILVKIVPTERCNREKVAAMADQMFREYTRGQVAFEVQFVDDIPKEASGKYRFTKSDVSLQRR
ncbi:MAG: phenylacetate--CoA ligase family protein [Chloroflexi bacterium]|nr:phenylacetate--CoA ligase family protein [Chloroflexota bacterium]